VDYLRGEIPRAIGESLAGVERVSTIVRAMKDFSHPGTEEKTPVDLNRAIESTITVARNEWKYVAELETSFDASLPPVPCLPGEFNQVVLNLIVNAAHAIAAKSSEAKGRIQVRTRRDAGWADIRVTDSGTGIPEKVRRRIFEPFFTTKEVGKGTGQGLAIARSVVVDKLGGTISFETETGRGTTFIVRLPLAIAEPERMAA
jgi:signal transduction histidine kinase